MNIFGWKSAGRGYLRPAKTRVQQDRLPGIRGYVRAALANGHDIMRRRCARAIYRTQLPSGQCG